MTINSIFKHINKFKKSVFFQNIAIVATGNVLAKLIVVLSAFAITRLYSTEEYGVFSIYMSIISVLGSIVTLRYSVAIPIAKDDNLVSSIIKLCFLISLVLSLLCVVGVVFLGDYIVASFSAPLLKPFLWFIPFVLLFKGVYETLNSWAIREKNFKLITRTKIDQSISATGFKVGLGFIGFTSYGLFWGHFFQELTGISRLFIQLKKLKSEVLKGVLKQNVRYVASRFKKFPLFQSWSQLLLGLGAQLPVLFIGLFFGLEVAGVFGLAQNMINMPMQLIGNSVSEVYFAEISKIGVNNPQKIYKLSVSILKKMFLIGLVVVIFLIAFGPLFFKISFGKEWYDAGVYARFLSLLILTRFLSNPLANIFNLFEMQVVQLAMNIIRVTLIFTTFYICNFLKFEPVKTILVYSSIMAVFYGTLTVIVLLIIKRKILEKNKK